MDWHIPLIIAAAAFMAFMILRVWPVRAMNTGGGNALATRAALKEARKKIEAAKSDAERVEALCAAGDVSARLVGGSARAVQYYLRAMKLAPTSVELVERVSEALARRPHSLENVLWRKLGSDEGGFEPEGVPAALVALSQLEKLYAGPLRSAVRARAMNNLAASIRSRAAT